MLKKIEKILKETSILSKIEKEKRKKMELFLQT